MYGKNNQKHNVFMIFMIIRRPLLARGHQAGRHRVEVTSQRSPVKRFHQIWGLRSASPGLVGCREPLDDQFTLNHPGSLNFGRSWKSIKFQCISNTPRNHQNGVSIPPKVSKMRSQEVPEVIKIMKMLKKWNLMKTFVFTNILKGCDMRNHKIVHVKIV